MENKRTKVTQTIAGTLALVQIASQSVAFGDGKTRTSAQTRAHQMAQAAETGVVGQIQKLINSGKYNGERGTEQFLSEVENGLDRLMTQNKLQLKETNEETLRQSLINLRKMAADQGNADLYNKIETLLSPSEESLKSKLAKQFSREKKLETLSHLKTQIQQAGSVNKLLTQEKERLLTRDGAQEWTKKLLFPAMRTMTSPSTKEENLIGMVIASPLVLAVDLILLPIWAVGLPFSALSD